MSVATYEAKKAYFAQVRRRNYIASLHLEGFDVSDQEPGDKLPSKAEALATHKRKAMV